MFTEWSGKSPRQNGGIDIFVILKLDGPHRKVGYVLRAPRRATGPSPLYAPVRRKTSEL